MRIAVSQIAPVIGAVDANRRRMVEAVRSAALAGASFVVLPELCSTGYVFADRDEAWELAEPVPGPTTDALQETCREHSMSVVAGVAERAGDGNLFNSAVVVDETGVVSTYRKAHLWENEIDAFAAGDNSPPVVALADLRVGVIVCYDLEFPEWARMVALAGADLVCVPTNWPSMPRPEGERPIEQTTVLASAAANRVFVAACDRVGAERGATWLGGSIIAGPDGYPLATADLSDAEQLLVADIDVVAARDKHIGPRNDRFADRRPELYGGLT